MNCTKVKFTSINRAKAAARLIKGHGEHMHPYICPECHVWHLGH